MSSAVNDQRAALELVRLFVNTLDVEDGVDALDRGWLADHGLIGRGDEVETPDLRRLRQVREATRELLLANTGVEVDVAAASAVLDAAAVRARLAVRFGREGTVIFEPAAAGIEGAIGRVLARIAAAMGSESWPRLKACRADDCKWAFFDVARNRSRVWCSMDVCGNRAKARLYRARHGATAVSDDPAVSTGRFRRSRGSATRPDVGAAESAPGFTGRA